MLLAKQNQTYEGHVRDCMIAADYILTTFSWSIGHILQRFPGEFSMEFPVFRKLCIMGVFLHDAGKLTEEWQQAIHNQRQGGKKKLPAHTPYSFAVMQSLFPSRDMTSFQLMKLAGVSHHGLLTQDTFSNESDFHKKEGSIPYHVDAFNEMKQKFSLVFAELMEIPDLSPDQELFSKSQIKTNLIINQMEHLKRKFKRINQTSKILNMKSLFTLFLWVISTADKWASRIAKNKMEQDPQKIFDSLVDAESVKQYLNVWANEEWPDIFIQDKDLRPFQKLMEHAGSFVFAVAPCGEGKTLAALRWGLSQIRAGQANRIIFCMPTQTTSNALYQQLIQNYNLPEEHVGIYHGDAEFFYEQYSEETKETAEIRNEDPHTVDNADPLFDSLVFQKSVVVTTADHLAYSFLHCYRFADYAFGAIQQAAIIFDELHVFDQTCMTNILELCAVMVKLKVPHVLMTATLPEFIEEAFYKQIPSAYQKVSSSKYAVSEANQGRYMLANLSGLILVEGNIHPNVIQLLEGSRGLRRILYVNVVQDAIDIYRQVKHLFQDENIVLYHSEFTRVDRVRKERSIQRLFKESSGTWQEGDQVFHASRGTILITTQIAEISLDISADLTISALAPCDALIQRAGRLHRKGQSSFVESCDCLQCNELRQKGFSDWKYNLYVADIHEGDISALYPYVSKETLLREPEHVLLRTKRAMETEREMSAVYEYYWIQQVFERNTLLMHSLLGKMIREDCLFGKTVQQRFGDEDSLHSEGGNGFTFRNISVKKRSIIPFTVIKEVEYITTQLSHDRTFIDFKELVEQGELNSAFQSNKNDNMKTLYKELHKQKLQLAFSRYQKIEQNHSIARLLGKYGVFTIADVPYQFSEGLKIIKEE